MKKYKIILLLSIVPLFLSTSFLKKTNRVEDKWRSNISTNFRGTRSLSTYEVRLTYTGYGAFVGIEDCPIRTNRGGYIQMRDTTSRGFTKHVTGSCDQEQLDEERDNVPLNTKACLFSGSELPMLTQRTLRVGRYVGTGDLVGVVVEVLRKVK